MFQSALWQLWRKVYATVPSETGVLKILEIQCLQVSDSLIGSQTFSDSIYLDVVRSQYLEIFKTMRDPAEDRWACERLRTYAGQREKPEDMPARVQAS